MSFSPSPEYGYVFLTLAATGLTLQWQAHKVGVARKAAGVAYPNCYATNTEAESNPKAKIFNCCQRAHSNTLENVTFILTSVVLNGLVHPKLSATLGAVWLFGRVLYFNGYATGDPKKRMRGTVGYIGTIGLLGTTLTIATQLLRGIWGF